MIKKFLIVCIAIVAVPVFIFFFRVGYMVVNECNDVPCYPYLEEAKKMAQKEFSQLCKKENLDCSEVEVSFSGDDRGCWLIFFTVNKHERNKFLTYDVCPSDRYLKFLDQAEIDKWPRKQQPKVDK